MLPTVQTPPSASQLSDFDGWFEQLIQRTRPDLVVSIARGAARLLQLRGLLPEVSGVPVVSDHALPFLADGDIRSRRVLLFDDSIIFGSTMADVSKYLSTRGAMVSHAAYVADKVSFYGKRPPYRTPDVERSPHWWLQPQVRKQLWPDDVRRHHAVLVQEVFDNGLDLNLDFPGLRVELNKFTAAEIPYLVHLLACQPAFRDVANVTSPVSGAKGVQRWTALHSQCSCAISATNVVIRPHCKTRVTFVPHLGVIRLSPIVQYAIRAGTDPAAIGFDDPTIDAAWREVRSHFVEPDE